MEQNYSIQAASIVNTFAEVANAFDLTKEAEPYDPAFMYRQGTNLLPLMYNAFLQTEVKVQFKCRRFKYQAICWTLHLTSNIFIYHKIQITMK